jgi:uncharacterized damage-inducible protein DinB
MADEQTIRDLVDKMAEERDKLLAQVDALSDEDAGRVPVDGEGPSAEGQWSVKQQCAHLAEMETAYRAWVGRALAEDNPDVTKTRGDSPAFPLEDANDRTISELATQLRDQRAQTLRMIENLRPDDFERSATQRMFGTLTVLQWLRSFYRHDRMHQDQIVGRDPTYKPRFAGGQEPDQRRARVQ